MAFFASFTLLLSQNITTHRCGFTTIARSVTLTGRAGAAIQDNRHDFSTVDPSLNRYNLARQVTVPLFHSWSHSLPTAGSLNRASTH